MRAAKAKHAEKEFFLIICVEERCVEEKHFISRLTSDR